MKGRPRKPYEMRVLEGGRGKSRPMNPDLPAPRGGLSRPKGLNAEERREWERHVDWLVAMKIDSCVDSGTVERAVVALVASRVMHRRFATSGEVKDLRAANDCSRLYAKFAAVLGLSPADRARMDVGQPDEPEGAGATPPDLRDADESGA